MKKKRMSAHKLHSRTGAYSRIIEILVPTRFYWNEDGSFDGIEFGPFNRPISRYQIGLVCEVLDFMCELMDIQPIFLEPTKDSRKRKTPIPDAFLRAFKGDKKTDGGKDNVEKIR